MNGSDGLKYMFLFVLIPIVLAVVVADAWLKK